MFNAAWPREDRERYSDLVLAMIEKKQLPPPPPSPEKDKDKDKDKDQGKGKTDDKGRDG